MRLLRFFMFVLFVVAAGSSFPVWAETHKNVTRLEEAERNFGFGFFRAKGYKDCIEPRVSFVKRKADSSEVIEYSWRPMQIYDMPHKERIDVIRCSFNKYFYTGKDRKAFIGFGVGGNVILFSQKCKDWAKANPKLDLKDGVNGLGRFFLGYKVSSIPLGKTIYPVIIRFDAFISPDYKFGGVLGKAGEKLELSEFKVGMNFSYE